MTNAITEKAYSYLQVLKDRADVNTTSADLMEIFGVNVQAVTGSINGLCKRGFAERVPGEITNEDGTHTPVKYIKVTEAGLAYDHEAAVAADEEVAAAKAAEKAAKAAEKAAAKEQAE